jgi:copper homeostasis protein
MFEWIVALYPDSLACNANFSGGVRRSLNWDAGMIELEICIDSVEAAIAAETGGAQRVELCSALIEGGLTPSVGMIRAVRSRIGIGLFVMIRPRGGDFIYSDEELAAMRYDIFSARQWGADGVVFGLLTPSGEVDVERTRELVELARPMKVTFHRAFDMALDMETALEDIVRTGADRVLTSGGEPTGILGSGMIARLVRRFAGRIGVMACGGIRSDNVQEIARATGADQFHAALRTAVPSPAIHRKAGLSMGEPGIDEFTRYTVLAEDVRSLREAIDAVSRIGN